MRELARFVAEAKTLAGRMDEIGSRLPAQPSAPFLHRQLERALVHMRQAIAVQLPEISAKMLQGVERTESGLLNRVRKTFSRRRDLSRDDIQKDIEENLEEGLQGNTWTIPIPDLLGFLATGRKTGVLWVHDAQETFLLQLDQGSLVHATSDGNPDRMRLGEVLVHLGKITAEELEEFLRTLGVEAGFLGAELVTAGVIVDADLTDALAYQIQEMFRRLLASRSSIFRFQEGICLMTRTDVHLNVQSVLLEVMRQADELNKALSLFDDEDDSLFAEGAENVEEPQEPEQVLEEFEGGGVEDAAGLVKADAGDDSASGAANASVDAAGAQAEAVDDADAEQADGDERAEDQAEVA